MVNAAYIMSILVWLDMCVVGYGPPSGPKTSPRSPKIYIPPFGQPSDQVWTGKVEPVSFSVDRRRMQSLIISWAVCVRLVLLTKMNGANVLAVGKETHVTSITPVRDFEHINWKNMDYAKNAYSNGGALRVIGKFME